jgi:Multicopper oxidase
MNADNPGTWLFHCHVGEHMESGMMATYTIYQPQPCNSPIQFVAGDFWNSSGKFRVTVKNISPKPIRNVLVTFDDMINPYIRRQPVNNQWNWSTEIKPGEEHTFLMPGWLPQNVNQAYAWILFPSSVTYDDGSTWQPQAPEACYKTYWRDKQHPQFTVLPTLQIDTGED